MVCVSGKNGCWGVGIESQIYAQKNIFITDQKVNPAEEIEVYKGTKITETGTQMNGTPKGRSINVLAAFNAAYDPDLLPDAGWTPTLFLGIDPTHRVIPLVESSSGPMEW